MKDPSPVHELTLERYRLGELPEAEMRGVRKALESDARLRERLAALERSDREILDARPPDVFAAEVERRVRLESPARPARARPWALVPISALALVVASGLFLRGVLPGSPRTGAVAPSGERAKGSGPSLLLFRQGADRAIERLDPGAVASARDVLQVAYQAGGLRYGVILSIDGRGVVTRHFPASGDEAGTLQPSGPAVLSAAYRLDDAPRLERFYFVASAEPFAVPPVMAAARDAGLDPLHAERLPLDAPLAQASFLLRKE